MRKLSIFLTLLLLGFLSSFLNAETCPDPKDPSFPYHIAPWETYQGDPQYDAQVTFVQVKIPPNVLANWGAVICTYENSLGKFSIWQQKKAKKTKARDNVDYWFYNRYLGYSCSESLEKCGFIIAK